MMHCLWGRIGSETPNRDTPVVTAFERILDGQLGTPPRWVFHARLFECLAEAYAEETTNLYLVPPLQLELVTRYQRQQEEEASDEKVGQWRAFLDSL